MAVYRYVAFDQQGVRQSGRLEAGSREEADSALRQRGLSIRQLKEVRPSIWSKEVALGGRSVSQEEISVTCRQLATLVGAGIGISESLRTLTEQMPKGPLKEALLEVDAGIRAGRGPAECMAEHPRVFPMVIVVARIICQHVLSIVRLCRTENIEDRIIRRGAVLSVFVRQGTNMRACPGL